MNQSQQPRFVSASRRGEVVQVEEEAEFERRDDDFEEMEATLRRAEEEAMRRKATRTGAHVTTILPHDSGVASTSSSFSSAVTDATRDLLPSSSSPPTLLISTVYPTIGTGIDFPGMSSQVVAPPPSSVPDGSATYASEVNPPAPPIVNTMNNDNNHVTGGIRFNDASVLELDDDL